MVEAFWKIVGVIFMATDFPLWAWPISLIVAAIAIFSVHHLIWSRHVRSRPLAIVLISSLVTLLLLPAFAVAFWADHGVDSPESQRLPSLILQGLWWTYVAALALAVLLARGYRFSVAGVAVVPLWFNFGVYFVCGMAVSGVWL